MEVLQNFKSLFFDVWKKGISGVNISSFVSKLMSFVFIVFDIGLFQLNPSTPNLGKYTALNLASSTSSLVLKRVIPSLEPKMF